MNIAVVYTKSGLGLSRDARILRGILSRHYIVEELLISDNDWVVGMTSGPFRRFRRLFYYLINLFFSVARIFRKHSYDIAIYLESYRPWSLGRAKYNILIPNQEWLSPVLIDSLGHFDEIWCKTHAAINVFSPLHRHVRFIGFSSVIDSALLASPKIPDLYLHRAGNSLLRGTATLLSTWAKHPEWPTLSVIMSDKLRSSVYSGELPSNVKFLDGGWTDGQFSKLMASAAVHIHPTEVEGYGLAISEALGYGCMVLATDAAPMNELVEEDRGILIPSLWKAKYNLGDLFAVQAEGIEKAMTELLTMTHAERDARMSNAHSWFVDNKELFEHRLLTKVREINDNR